MDKNHWFYKDILKPIFKHEAIIVIIKGYWKTGITNVGLRIIEDLLDTGLIKVAGTNIKIDETDKIKIIQDFDNLIEFHFDDPINPKHKAFVFDEAGKLTVKRRAMGKVNVEWMKFIPELSKGRMKLIVITQAEFLTDSMFTETEFTRASITTYKHSSKDFSILIESELINDNRYFINSFPMCDTKYSPYQPADWFNERIEGIEKTHEYACCEIARLYAIDRLSTNKIANIKGWTSRKKVTRLLKRHIRHTLRTPSLEDLEEMKKDMDTLKSVDIEEIIEIPS